MDTPFSILPTWNLDALGNAGSGTTQGVIQTNSYNSQNEMTGAGSAALAFDANGNTTVDDQGHTLVYDAWNRLVSVQNGSTVIASYTYDAVGRRVTETESGNINHLYYSAQWQVLEERLGGTSSVNVTQQYVWSATYVDAMILRDNYYAKGWLMPVIFGGRQYVQHDTNYNVTALLTYDRGTSSWSVQERYVYDPYGKVTVLNADATVRGDGTTASSAYGWRYLHQGGRFDLASGLYLFRHRDYSPTMQRWLEQDPAGYRGDPAHGNFYRYVGGNPLGLTDASGLCPENGGPGGPGSPGSNNKPVVKAAAPNKAGSAAGAYAKAIGLGATQGLVNTVNGVQDIVIGIANLPALAINGSLWVAGSRVRAPYIPSPDWSRNLVTEEDFHQTSKFLAGQGAFTLATLGLSQLGTTGQAADLGQVTSSEEAVAAAENTVVRYVGSTEAQIAQDTGFIPNVDRLGNLKTVFVTPEEPVTSVSQAESAYQIGSQNPLGSSSAPTHVIVGNPEGITFDYGGNVEGGTGVELTTEQRIPVISVQPIGGH